MLLYVALVGTFTSELYLTKTIRIRQFDSCADPPHGLILPNSSLIHGIMTNIMEMMIL